ncbi:unnamed protein product [Arabis nemorensis]|uniref:YGGT family protein n=1 Tax=Arabis nemorensis TaxID=586526 RepID=A0A565B7R3_9BRAS|nr:unnamed protein product [Arabis nemorensis]
MAATATHTLPSPVFFPPSSSINPRFHGYNKKPPSRLFLPPLSPRNPKPIRITASSPSLITPITSIKPATKPTAQSSTITGSTRSLASLAALTIAVAKVIAQKLNPGIGHALRFSLRTAGPVFFASLRDRPTGNLNTPLTVVAVGIKKWLDIYSGVLMVRVLLSWFPNIPWERQPLSAIRDLCDPYLNLFRNIIPPIFDTLDVSPLLAFAVLGTLGSIVHGSTG